ncbi:alpha/beta fold hydrolase [Geodermatophilus maliterrae]|uniref:Alpha/beta fold hydrolase n=1 Tax=Geodermatophilus maliterrae TaxID=3162531 RepID=A0ABV3XHI7_9ACTN
MNRPVTGFLDRPGGRLYHEVCGSGPPLLLIPTGNGDAGPYRPVAGLLGNRYTVITYDRLGFSRSSVDGPVDDDQRLDGEVDDVRALLDHLVGGPAHVFGTCTGATIALALLARLPDRVRLLFVHEPPVVSVLPEAAEEIAFHEAVYATYRQQGLAPALAMFKGYLGADGGNRPPEAFQPPPQELRAMLTRIRDNQRFWMEHDMRTFPAFVPDVEALRTVADRVVLLGGEDSRHLAGARVNVVLAERLGVELVDVPGGHLGHVTHPREFSERLAVLLEQRG